MIERSKRDACASTTHKGFLVKSNKGDIIHKTEDLMEARKMIEGKPGFYVHYDQEEVEKYNEKMDD